MVLVQKLGGQVNRLVKWKSSRWCYVFIQRSRHCQFSYVTDLSTGVTLLSAEVLAVKSL